MIIQVRDPFQNIMLETHIPDDMWEGITTGQYSQVMWPVQNDDPVMPRIVIIQWD